MDYDGKIGMEEFDSMIETAAALPRKYSYNWWGEESYSDDAGRKKYHEDMFKAMDSDGDGAVSFDEWLAYALKQYSDKAGLPTALDQLDKDAFIAACKGAAVEGSAAHAQLYWFNVKCFQSADSDRDGLIGIEEFSSMIECATSAQKRYFCK